MLDIITRRGFLARGLAATAGLAAALPMRGTFAARKRLTVYVLDPSGFDGCTGCTGCRACRLHAANKLFASAEAADAHRAHPNCDCTIRPAGNLPTGIWFALFGPSRSATSGGTVDRRHARVAALLAGHEDDLF